MILWIDAQLPPKLAAWFGETFGIEAKHVEDIGRTTISIKRRPKLAPLSLPEILASYCCKSSMAHRLNCYGLPAATPRMPT